MIAIGDLQRYQYEKLQLIYAKKAYSFKRNTIQFSDDQQLVFHKGDAQVIEARGKDQELVLEIDGKQQSVHFDLLVDASGKPLNPIHGFGIDKILSLRFPMSQ